MCKVHGNGTKDCRCSLTLDSYQTTLRLFNTTNTKTKDPRRKLVIDKLSIKSFPHFVTPELAEFVAEHIGELHDLGHKDPEIIWDDGCCAAAYCEDCKTWGWFTYNYETEGERWSTEEEAEYGGRIFDDKCEAQQYTG
jgi:hypothetical protein